MRANRFYYRTNVQDSPATWLGRAMKTGVILKWIKYHFEGGRFMDIFHEFRGEAQSSTVSAEKPIARMLKIIFSQSIIWLNTPLSERYALIERKSDSINQIMSQIVGGERKIDRLNYFFSVCFMPSQSPLSWHWMCKQKHHRLTGSWLVVDYNFFLHFLFFLPFIPLPLRHTLASAQFNVHGAVVWAVVVFYCRLLFSR
jgi:hypothetical protein